MLAGEQNYESRSNLVNWKDNSLYWRKSGQLHYVKNFAIS